ncbi:RUN and FYVE domain containing 4 [Chelydra serpentina]|uniref:RUN and FYVE domain-containing protein 4 n=2 Tax=Chelydra serpentina TaxID=8475 RepID=A0A8T1SNI7_CHESE|nr:RUN and FYVE domain containing 4 [Chelydra serpentina]
MAGAGELLRMIQDLRNTVGELKQNYKERHLPVTDGSRELHGLCAQLEFLLQFDLKEKRSFFGQRRDYWDFLCQGLARRRQGHEGVQFVSSLEKLRTPVGKGRAFVRYCLVHRQLAESLQLCFLDPQITSDWYYARSPFLHPQPRADILGCLYELDGVTFHLALKRADLDAAWPMFSEPLSRSSSQSPVHSRKEGPAWPVGHPAGDSEQHPGARRGPQEEPQLPGQLSPSPGLGTNGPFQPALEESRERTSAAGSQDNGPPAGSQPQGAAAAGDGKPEAELQRANAQLQLQVEALGSELQSSLAAARELESTSVRQAQRHSEERGRLRREAEEQIRELQDSKAVLSDALEETEALVGALRRQLSGREEETASLRAAQAEELAEREGRHRARLAEEETRRQELAERLCRATRDAEREAAAAAGLRQEARAAAEALEEAERRLRAQEAERREHLAGAEAQALRHRQLLERCQRLQEKLSASEGRLEEKEAQVVALQSRGRRGGPSGSPPEEETARRAAPEDRLRQAEELSAKLERALSEGRELERAREALLESAVAQGQSLAAARLEARDLREELAAQQERKASLRAALARAERALTDREEGARGLQEELEGQSAKLRDALAANAALAARLAEAGAGFAREKAQLEARGAEERAGHERAAAELRRRLAECEEHGRAVREETQQLQAGLRGASEERDGLATQARTAAAALESRAREAAQLRGELEELRARCQREDTRLQEALARQEESDGQVVALRHQVRTLDLEKQRAADTLEQARGQLAAVLAEKEALEEMLARAAAELERAGGGGRPEAGAEEPLGLARGRGAAEEKAAGGGGPQTGRQVPLEDLGATTTLEEAGPEQKPRKGVEEMVKHLTTHLEKAMGEAQQKGQLLKVKEEEAKHLAEQLGRARQDGEQARLALETAQRDAKEREKKHRGQLAEQQELVREVKGRLLELLREKDALWQKMEGIDPSAPGVGPQDLSLCARCRQDFGFLSRRYQCRLCQGTVCQACSVESGRRERCCLLCWQKRNLKGP